MRYTSLLHRVVFGASLFFPTLSAAQAGPGPRAFCWLPAPKTSCSVIVLTDFGAYAMAGSRTDPLIDQSTGRSGHHVVVKPRATADWGFLVNLAPRDAIGATFFAAVEATGSDDRAEVGLFARYRHWLGPRRSLDLAVGTPILQGNSDDRSSIYTLVKLNLDPRLGIALRPELRRTTEFSLTGLPRARSDFFLSAGIEIGEKPGFGLGVLGGGLLLVLTLIAIGNSD